MRQALVGLLTLMVIPNANAQAPKAQRQFDFRGAVLGMTLDEFKALPPLSDARLIRWGEGRKILGRDLLFKCEPSKTGTSAKVGVIDCERAGDDPFTGGGGRPIFTNITYSFLPSEGSLKLYNILVFTGRDNIDQARSGMVEKWGPSKDIEGTVTNGFGQPLPSMTSKWTRPGSVITLEYPCASVKNICITYMHLGLAAEFGKAVEKLQGSTGSRF